HSGFKRMHPADVPRVMGLLARLVAHPSEPLTDQFRYRHADGSWRWIEAAGANRLADPSIGAIIINYRDVTVRREAQEALRESEERFRSLSASSPLGIFLADTEGQCVYANPRFRALFNHSLRQTIGKGWLRSVLEEDRASVEEAWQTSVCQTQDFSREFRLRGPNGMARWVHLRASPMFSDGKELLGHVGTIEDITNRRAVEQQLRLQAGALEAAANGIVITDRSGVIIWVNTAFSRLTGYSIREAIGQTPRLIKSGKQDAAFYSEMWETILAGRVWHGQLVNRRKDGAFYTEEMTITPVREAGGEISHFIAIKQDVSERRQLEEQFRQSQKMEAVGRLAGGVAHDFNNLLMAILGYSDMILGERELGGKIRESAEEVKAAAERAASLTRQLLAFSRRQMLAPQVINLNAIVTGIENMLRRLIGEDIALIIRLKEPLRHVKADPNQIEQVILNLAINARDAMPRGGKLIIETNEVSFDEAHCRRNRELQPGAYVVLLMSDTGSGMPAEVLDHLFEPFFTTKQQGKGTGLGLATVYGIVKQSGGDIGVYSEVGFGTTFKVYLPAAKTGKTEMNGLRVRTDSHRGTETILLVEDDEGVRRLVRETLKHLGYTVLEASDGAEAIERFGREPQQVHLMITDVVMPGLGGCAS
ncbi:MAG: PAS domain S-box protein, partial [Verrucomicrobia bacterium]|nr:PAS domain S-box protein [Verrucomicrobiota bacterium]